MTFVNDDVLPDELREDSLIVHNVLVGCDEDIEFLTMNDFGEQWSLRLLALVNNDFDIGCPLLELQSPIGDRCQRHNH